MMAKYKIVKRKYHLSGAGRNAGHRLGNNAGFFLLECGHIAVVDNVNWRAQKCRCYECTGTAIASVPPMVLNILDRMVRAGVITWDEVDTRLHP